LTHLEAQIVELSAHALTGKAVGCALGLGAPAKSLASSAFKLGIRA
jgi:hypothetical protein